MLKGSCHCGAVRWTRTEKPATVSACSCTLCRRYGVLWAYGHMGHEIEVEGETSSYRRADSGDIDLYFCRVCGCLTHYMSNVPKTDGRYWSAVNVRMCEPDEVGDIPVRHFDGLSTWADLPPDGRTVGDLWF